MTKDKVWEKIKSDESILYGQPIIDVFLQLTNQLKPKHYDQLSEEQKEKVSPRSLHYIFDEISKSDDPQKAFEFLGVEKFNKIKNPIDTIVDDDEKFEKMIELTRKHHKKSNELSFDMCILGKSPKETIKYYGVENIYKSAKKNSMYTQDSEITREILIRAFAAGELEQVGELLNQDEIDPELEPLFVKEKISSMSSNDFQEFIVNIKARAGIYTRDKETATKITKKLQDFALKYREELSRTEIENLSSIIFSKSRTNYVNQLDNESKNDFFWKVFEKQGLKVLIASEIILMAKMNTEKALNSFKPEDLKRFLIVRSIDRLVSLKRVWATEKSGISTYHLSTEERLSLRPTVAAELLLVDLRFAKIIGSEIITMMDHMDLKFLLRDFHKSKLGDLLKILKKYHKELDKRIQRLPELGTFF